MWSIYPILSRYQLDDLSSLRSRFAEISDNQLLELMGEVVNASQQDGMQKEAAPKGIDFCPIGGDLSLGNFQEISRQLLLYADRVVLEEPLTDIAKHAIECQKITPSHDEFLQRVYPLIRQLLLIQPAVEVEVIVFVHQSLTDWGRVSELADKIIHPQLDRIKHKLSDLAVCYRQPNGMLSFTFGGGSNQFNVLGGAIFSNARLLVHGMMPDMDKDTSLGYGDWQPPPGSKRIPSRLIESDVRSNEALKKVVNHIITRVILGTHVAQESKSSYITDDPIEWEIIKMLSRIEGEQKRSSATEHVADALAIQIAKELVFLEEVSVKDLLELRTKYSGAFSTFRGRLFALLTKVQEIDDLNMMNKIAKRIVAKEISPAISEIRSTFDSIHKQRLRDATFAVGVAGLWVMTYLFAINLQPWGGTLPIVWAAKRELDRLDEADELSRKPMYFLWQVVKRAK